MKRIWIVLFLIVAFSLSGKEAQSKKKKYSLAVCAIFQNEARYLKEWIEYHRQIGVEHFYLYNNLSTDHYREVLKPYRINGIVNLIEWPYNTNPDGKNWPMIQVNAYMDNLKKAKMEAKWVAYIDTDEFIVPIEGRNLVDVLKDYEGFGGVCINWQCYGTSGVKKIQPHELMIKKLIYRGLQDHPMNSHVKSIVRPNRVDKFHNPHTVAYKRNYFQVNERKERFQGAHSPYISVEKLRINHYWTRDEEFFYHEKIPRREKWGTGKHHLIEVNNQLNQVEDKVIYRHLPKM